MAVRLEEKDRRLIPNWRSFEVTASLGELNSCGSNKHIVPNMSIDSYIRDFLKYKTLPYAADLLSASIVNGIANDYSFQAAKFIREHEELATKSQIDVASLILNGKGVNYNINLKDVTINELDSSIKVDDYRHRIGRLKAYVKDSPYNPMSWVELSRCYSIIGQEEPAKKAMRVALHLAPDNRYVLRSAVRLFSHYDELDVAHSILKNRRTLYDPWLISAEISIANLEGKTSRYIRRGMEMIESNDFSPFSITELASSIATIELFNGNRKKSRKLFRQSLESPNDNSKAQLEWVVNNKDKSLLPKELIDIQIKQDFEAQAISNFYKKNFIEALDNTCQWLFDMPYSIRPVLLGSCISDILGYRQLSIEFIRKGLIAHSNDAQLLNNMAYYLALDDKTQEAHSYLNKVDFCHLNKFTEMCLTATKGLLCFREKKIEQGRFLYLKAIEETKQENNKELNWTAILNYAREEIIARTENIESVMNVVSQIPETDDTDVSIRKLQKDVFALYDEYKGKS